MISRFVVLVMTQIVNIRANWTWFSLPNISILRSICWFSSIQFANSCLAITFFGRIFYVTIKHYKLHLYYGPLESIWLHKLKGIITFFEAASSKLVGIMCPDVCLVIINCRHVYLIITGVKNWKALILPNPITNCYNTGWMRVMNDTGCTTCMCCNIFMYYKSSHSVIAVNSIAVIGNFRIFLKIFHCCMYAVLDNIKLFI